MIRVIVVLLAVVGGFTVARHPLAQEAAGRAAHCCREAWVSWRGAQPGAAPGTVVAGLPAAETGVSVEEGEVFEPAANAGARKSASAIVYDEGLKSEPAAAAGKDPEGEQEDSATAEDSAVALKVLEIYAQDEKLGNKGGEDD